MLNWYWAEDDVRGVIWPERHRDYLSDTPLGPYTRRWRAGHPTRWPCVRSLQKGEESCDDHPAARPPHNSTLVWDKA